MSSAEEKRKARMARILARKQKGEQALANSLMTGNIKELEKPEKNSQKLQKNEEKLKNSDLPKIDQDETDGLLDRADTNSSPQEDQDVFTRFKNLKKKEENLVIFGINLEKIYPAKIAPSAHGGSHYSNYLPCICRVGQERKLVYDLSLLQYCYNPLLLLEKRSQKVV